MTTARLEQRRVLPSAALATADRAQARAVQQRAPVKPEKRTSRVKAVQVGKTPKVARAAKPEPTWAVAVAARLALAALVALAARP